MLYIGLNGYIGSGKDTLAKLLYLILNYNWESKEKCKEYYVEFFKKHRYATLPTDKMATDRCFSIAFADQLKTICSTMFGIPVEYFYYNKDNGWICINHDFEYTEERPPKNYIITAEEFYLGNDYYSNGTDDKYYMSLREILVYVGTYVCQRTLNKNVFVNIVNNTIKNTIKENKNIQYVICTDVRFLHEQNFIKKNGGIMINITRDIVGQQENIAERSLNDNNAQFDYTINNDGSYDDLFDKVWDLTHNNLEFRCIEHKLQTRYDTGTYVRLIDKATNDESYYEKYRLCFNSGISRVNYIDDNDIGFEPEIVKINLLDLVGGPLLIVGDSIMIGEETKIIEAIILDTNHNAYYIICK